MHQPIIKAATITLKLPITCCQCGCIGWSEPIKLELRDTNLDAIRESIRSERIGTRFPVGWASFHSSPTDKYKCPKCLEIST